MATPTLIRTPPVRKDQNLDQRDNQQDLGAHAPHMDPKREEDK